MYSKGCDVRVDVGRQLVAHVSGVHRCGSPWACPLCAPTIRRRRAEEIDGAIERWIEGGGGVEMLTQTARHHLDDPLADRLGVMATALGLVLKGSGWQRRRDRLGYAGSIKSVEVTHNLRNGWHPHAHSLLLFARPLTTTERADLCAWITGRWSEALTKRGLGSLHAHHGVDLRQVGHAGVGEYLTKVDGGWSAGYEIARGDLKSSSPVQILREAAATGDTQPMRLWQEYEEATFGRASIRWSRGLRGLLCGMEEAATDEELAASEGLDLALLRALVPAEVWSDVITRGVAGQLLTEIEQAAAVLLWLGDRLGFDPDPLEVPGALEVAK